MAGLAAQLEIVERVAAAVVEGDAVVDFELVGAASALEISKSCASRANASRRRRWARKPFRALRTFQRDPEAPAPMSLSAYLLHPRAEKGQVMRVPE